MLNFSNSRENSYEALLVLTNETKVALAVIGTEDAYEKMFSNLRMTRRIGTTISGSFYCQNKEFCEFLIRNLFQYQWFDTPIELTAEISDALYENTCGIVDQLVGLYMHIQLAYLSSKNRPDINAKYIEDIFNQYYPGAREFLKDIKNPHAQIELKRLLEKSQKQFNDTKQLIEAKALMDEADSIRKNILKKKVIDNIQRNTPEYSTDDISKAFTKVISEENPDSLSETELTQKVLMTLQCTPPPALVSTEPKSKKKPLAVSHDAMQEELLK